MNNSKLLAGAFALTTILTGCPGPTEPPVDGGARDMGTVPTDTNADTNAMAPDMAVPSTDSGIPVTCEGYCTQIAMTCTGANQQYTDMGDCMTHCTNADWTMGTQSDTAGNTLGCRVYHATAAAGSAANATTHCPHAGYLSVATICSPFRSDPADEGTPTTAEGAYVRVDRMGFPAVGTALIGPGLDTGGMPTVPLAAKDAYNDSSPTGDAMFAANAPILVAIGALHGALDADLIDHDLTPCSVAHSFPVPGAPVQIPACGVQDVFGEALGAMVPQTPVANLILPDTLRIDPTAAAGFPNGRQPQDDVIDPILSVLLLAMTPCSGSPTGTLCSGHTGGSAAADCAADTNCTWSGTACNPAVTSRLGSCLALGTAGCAADPRCTVSSGACVTQPCEGFATGTCGAQAGCSASTCGAGATAPRCAVGTIGSLPLNPHANDVAFLPTFPYFAAPH